jgi:hypothetical protein
MVTERQRPRWPPALSSGAMTLTRPIPLSPATLALVLVLATPAFGASASRVKTVTSKRPLAQAQLWATIDVCNPYDQPDTVGIRGSMPGNGQSGVSMFMRFRLQYMDTATKRWLDLSNGATPSFVAVGGAKSARQAGRSFQLVPVPGKPAFVLRGVVNFQWRRGTTVVESLSRPTTAGHQSLAGADPAGFSAATCSIG